MSNPYSGIPILRALDPKSSNDQDQKHNKMKKLQTKYFVDSDEDDEIMHIDRPTGLGIQPGQKSTNTNAKGALSFPSLFREFAGLEDDK